ncbi:MAG TPA: hypothetical protein VKV27_06420 [Solirubrobacteraceae bacterium]|nr:hypothetical protein [Solirubrobacteraceae bacterium]
MNRAVLDVLVRVIWPPAKLVAGAIALPVLCVIAALEGRRTRRRVRRGSAARVMWGPSPIINIRYWSESLRAIGYDSLTVVHHVPPINRREDFDVLRDSFLPGVPRADLVRDFFVFAWAIRRADVFVWYFDGGFLTGTALRSLELRLLRLAGKRVIVLPYGGDIAVVGELGVAEAALLEDYPELVRASARKRRRVLHICRHADLVIRNYQYGFLPRADVVWPTVIAIDCEAWRPQDEAAGGADGRSGEVVVLHAPNHRSIKGTRELIEAVGELQQEGLKVVLELAEGWPNERVLEAMRRADIVADQFIAGYALFAVEGMSAGKPVLSALGWMPPDVAEWLRRSGCPIVDTDVSTLTANLRDLVTDPGRRAALGRAGREYVLRCHSYGPVARIWAGLIEHVWSGAPLPAELAAISPDPAA